jgi:hypothetical protein
MDLFGGWAVGRYRPVMGFFCGGGVQRNLTGLIWMVVVFLEKILFTS